MTHPARCVRCRLERCVCAAIPRLRSRTRVVIVRHAAERWKTSNTGRFAHLALVNSELLDYGFVDAPLDESRLPSDEGTVVLYPDTAGSPPLVTPPRTLIVLDGTWSQARRMRQRLRRLRGLPFLALPAGSPRERLRRPLDPAGMSTLEAIARALALVEDEALATALDRLHDEIVRACLRPRPFVVEHT